MSGDDQRMEPVKVERVRVEPLGKPVHTGAWIGPFDCPVWTIDKDIVIDPSLTA